MVLLGLRGTGKTALLNEIGRRSGEHPFLVSTIEAAAGATLAALLYPQMQKVLRSLAAIGSAKTLAQEALGALQRFAAFFHIDAAGAGISVEPPQGAADSDKLECDLPELFAVIGRAARAAQKGWLLLLDEMQCLKKEDFSALLAALHHVNQLELPVMFVDAGLPPAVKLTREVKASAKQLFHFCEIGPLTADEARDAVARPVADAKACIEEDALTEMVRGTHGYPFFLQQWACCAWNIAEGNVIDLSDVRKAYAEAVHALDRGFFGVMFAQLTPQEKAFAAAMASLGRGPYRTGQIAQAMGKTTAQIGPLRSRMAGKGVIYSPGHGVVAFTVPLFDAFVRKQNPQAFDELAADGQLMDSQHALSLVSQQLQSMWDPSRS